MTESGGAPGSGGASSSGRKFVGNITTGWPGAMDTDGYVFSDYWDQVSPENAGKWGSVQSNGSSAYNWSTLDAIYQYTENKGILFKQHAFVWGSQQPQAPLTEQNVRNWISAFCERYPNTKLIDVVNEPPPHTEPSYSGAIGGGTNGDWAWITNAFKWARESCGDAVLILNDYNNIEYGDQNQHFIDIAKIIVKNGAPVDALGVQAHGLTAVSTDTMKQLITKMHNDTGLPIYVTEYDINLNDDTAQLNKFKEHVPFFMETEWIHGLTVWGWIYGKTWVDNSGLIRNGQPRPALTWLMDYVNQQTP